MSVEISKLGKTIHCAGYDDSGLLIAFRQSATFTERELPCQNFATYVIMSNDFEELGAEF